MGIRPCGAFGNDDVRYTQKPDHLEVIDMKKLPAFFLAAVSALSLTACSVRNAAAPGGYETSVFSSEASQSPEKASSEAAEGTSVPEKAIDDFAVYAYLADLLGQSGLDSFTAVELSGDAVTITSDIDFAVTSAQMSALVSEAGELASMLFSNVSAYSDRYVVELLLNFSEVDLNGLGNTDSRTFRWIDGERVTNLNLPAGILHDVDEYSALIDDYLRDEFLRLDSGNVNWSWGCLYTPPAKEVTLVCDAIFCGVHSLYSSAQVQSGLLREFDAHQLGDYLITVKLDADIDNAHAPAVFAWETDGEAPEAYVNADPWYFKYRISFDGRMLYLVTTDSLRYAVNSIRWDMDGKLTDGIGAGLDTGLQFRGEGEGYIDVSLVSYGGSDGYSVPDMNYRLYCVEHPSDGSLEYVEK